ncbi:hypothetical protein ACIQB5_33420 [Streptomyces sp. NPDC088560]|uniref:hypothetical protein n=1 Tax=Streptomyces sp. NPDC088560 TaxID=3365868 RepID=UPI00380F3B88
MSWSSHGDGGQGERCGRDDLSHTPATITTAKGHAAVPISLAGRDPSGTARRRPPGTLTVELGSDLVAHPGQRDGQRSAVSIVNYKLTAIDRQLKIDA